MTVNGTDVYYTYNADGIRIQKMAGALGHVYVLDGSTILKETIYTAGVLADTLCYYYDESGVSGLEYNGTKYTYVKNLQGDVIRIINSNGATVVEYKYDAWGNILSVTGSLASTLGAINPFRYRGYYYDTESGWYYLNSRYYDPQVGRFLNADGYVSTGQGLSSYNMFAYCLGNPVGRKDISGAESVVVTTPEDDDNPLNDLGGPVQGGGMSSNGGSAGGGSTAGGSTGGWGGDGVSSGYYVDFSMAVNSSLSTGGLYAGNVTFGYTSSGVSSTYSTRKGALAYEEAYINSVYNMPTRANTRNRQLSNDELKAFGRAGKNRGFRVVDGSHADAMQFVKSQTNGLFEYESGKFLGKNSNGVEFRVYKRERDGYTSIRIKGIENLNGIKFLWENGKE
jgi:RHS repeat-associated protein